MKSRNSHFLIMLIVGIGCKKCKITKENLILKCEVIGYVELIKNKTQW